MTCFRLIVLLLAAALVTHEMKAVCNVAPTVFDDEVEATGLVVVVDVLANDSDAEGQELSLSLDGSTCPGSAAFDAFGLLNLTLPSLLAADCIVSYTATNVAGLSSSGNVRLRSIAEIFADGFENGSTVAWSDTIE